MKQINSDHKKFHAVIVAAGSGTRFCTEYHTPKQYLSILGKPILSYSIEKFQSVTDIATITVVINNSHRHHYDVALEKLNSLNKIQPPITGGSNRSASVLNALKQLSQKHAPHDIILIHDAARPLITEKSIQDCINRFEKDEIKALTLANRTVNTLVNSKENSKEYGSIVEREHIWNIQTPQAFEIDSLYKAHLSFDKNATDDASIMRQSGEVVHIQEGPATNIKLTYQEDADMIKALLMTQEQYVQITGQGYDVHAFDINSKADHIRIGGIDIPHDKKLKAHSDGDVVLHSICDSIYGALSKGDIGSHFPPSDNANKNRNSEDFIKHALQLTDSEASEILHLDITIIGERPKIDPYRDQMREKIASLLKTPISRIAVKATTTEKLGFTGREEGLACQTTVTINRKMKNL